MTGPLISIIVPVYNEEKRVGKTLEDFSVFFSKSRLRYEIIAVNDGSSDNTINVLKESQTFLPNLKILSENTNRGKGYAVRRGMLEAKGDYRIFTDADNSTSIDQIVNLLSFLKEGFDIVIGSRIAKGAEIVVYQPFHKKYMGKIGNLIIQAIACPGISDTQCGFKGFTAKSANDIFSRAFINGWAFDVEALFLGKKLGYKTKVVPVRWIDNPESHVTFKGYILTFVEVFLIRAKWLLP